MYMYTYGFVYMYILYIVHQDLRPDQRTCCNLSLRWPAWEEEAELKKLIQQRLGRPRLTYNMYVYNTIYNIYTYI